ncbi:MAG: AmmeMemoRadiSam system protein A [Rhodospirillum sp.]|nr:AmmeMemoRadiSam system protein A [Rhodospirillum sp.]MCF8488632.1 AmmeMemoRadiSam system protein A [Rhodospirillum sp.]MCF8500693.1 AmmeMemoRadiSam system protein A [Rhodospirillum sp.]
MTPTDTDKVPPQDTDKVPLQDTDEVPPQDTDEVPPQDKGGREVEQDPLILATRDHGDTLLVLAAEAIVEGLRDGRPTPPDLATQPGPLRAKGAAFVTLTKGGQLRGCIGSVGANRPLALDVAANAWAAATRDPRFPRLTLEELPELALSVSVLTTPVPMTFSDQADLLSQIRPGVDGLILSDTGYRGLFLPQVWESLPSAPAFLAHLKQKAGLPLDHWSDALRMERFEARSVKAERWPLPLGPSDDKP